MIKQDHTVSCHPLSATQKYPKMLFKSIATFATFALSAVSVFAAPTAEPDALVKKAKPNGIAKIFADATTALTPHTQQLSTSHILVHTYCSTLTIVCAQVLSVVIR